MKDCPKCNNIDVPDKADRCPYCGYYFKLPKEIDIAEIQPDTIMINDETKNDNKVKKMISIDDILNQMKKKKFIFIIATAVILVCLIWGVKPNKKTENVNVSVKENATTLDKEQKSSKENAKKNVSASDMKKMEELKAASVQMEGIMEWDRILDETSVLLSANETSSEMKTLSIMIFDEFYQNSLEYIDMIKGIEDFNVDMYQECAIRFNELDKWNEILNSGYDEKIASDRELCKKEYKNKFINLFDERCEETVTENGVISRTVAWEIMKGLENTDLYNANSEGVSEYRYDSLRLRYITAKVLKLQKEISSMNKEEAINTIKNAMVECDYDPMLVYLLAVYEYEPAITWIYEIDDILSAYLDGVSYITLTDTNRINFVYSYNIDSQSYRECREKVINYMQDYYY